MTSTPRVLARSWLNRALVGLTALLVAAIPDAVHAQNGARTAANAYSTDQLLVRFAPGTAATVRTQVAAAAGTETETRYTLVPGLERLRLLPGRSVDEVVATLSRNPNVLFAEPDYVVQADATPNDASLSQLWGMGSIRAPAAWDISTGNDSFVVAVIDTGVDRTHPDLQGNLWQNPGELPNGLDDDGNGYIDDLYGWDFFGRDNNPSDEDNHGTHVSGTIGARGNNSIGVVGVNWRIKIVGLRFIGPNGGYISDAILALQYAVRMGFKVSNNSWGGGGYSSSMSSALDAARVAGHLFIAAAGNSGINSDASPQYPASYPQDNVIAVAAIDSSDRRASFSNYGATTVDIGAPGVNILSSVRGGYASYSGTSMASPHVAGAAAMIYARNPAWSYREVRNALLRTARPVASLSTSTATGGKLDLMAALTYTPSLTVPAAPSSLAAVATSSSSIALTWQDNATNEAGYRIERSTDGVAYTQIASLGANTVGHTVSGLSAATRYWFRVLAYNDAGTSAYSASTEATTMVAVASPSAPVMNTPVVSGSTATLSWTNVAQETGYQLGRAAYDKAKLRCGTFGVIRTLGADVTQTTDSPGTGAFCYAVRAVNGTALSSWSNAVAIEWKVSRK